MDTNQPATQPSPELRRAVEAMNYNIAEAKYQEVVARLRKENELYWQRHFNPEQISPSKPLP